MEYPEIEDEKNIINISYHLSRDVVTVVRKYIDYETLIISSDNGRKHVAFFCPPGGVAAIAKEILKQIGETDEKESAG